MGYVSLPEGIVSTTEVAASISLISNSRLPSWVRWVYKDGWILGKWIYTRTLEKTNGGGSPEMEVDGSDDFPDFNWVIFRFHVNFSGVYIISQSQ